MKRCTKKKYLTIPYSVKAGFSGVKLYNCSLSSLLCYLLNIKTI